MTSPHEDQPAHAIEGWSLESPDDLQGLPETLRAWAETPNGRDAIASQIERDRYLRSRLSGVPVPAGLEQAIRRTLAAEAELVSETSGESPRSTQAVGAVSVTAASSERAGRSERKSRRQWLAWSTVASLVIVVAGTAAAWRLWFEPRPTGSNEVAQSSLVWAERLDSNGWSAIDPNILHAAPIPEELGVSPVRFTRTRTDWDTETIVYDLAGPERSLALLYVVRVDRRFAVPERFLTEPDYTTGRHAVGSMSRGGRLYVLMVEGDARRFRAWLKGVGPLG